MTDHSKLINKWVIIGAAITAVAVLLYSSIILASENFRNIALSTPVAQITVLAAGEIPTPDIRLLEITPTPPQDENNSITGINISNYVKIEGTEGSGLRIRTGPGLNTDTVFVANESDVYIVIDGPVELDGLVWWKLATPYDEKRQGWAAADYLVKIASE